MVHSRAVRPGEPATMPNGNARHETSETGDSAGVLVPFHEEGDKPPLYFIPAGYGDLRLFRYVVDRLDGDRPVYGLQPPKVERLEGVRKKPAKWLISAYAAEMRRIQPAGPYHLSGYSSGGLLAVHVAQQLIREGDAVDLLVLLDPPLQNPWWINLSFIGVNRLCNLSRVTDAVRWRIIRRWDSLLLRCLSDEGLCTHVSILRERKAEPYPGHIVFFRPRRSWIRLVGRTRIGMSWHGIARDGLEVHRVPGAHNEMLRGRQGRIFAGVLRSCLKRGKHVAPEPPSRRPGSWAVKRCAKTLYSASVEPGRIDEVFDWDAMERLHERGLISDPVETARSGAFVEAEFRNTAGAVDRLFGANV